MLTERLQELSPSIFRAYDVRGIVGKTLTEGVVFQIGKAIGSMVQESGEKQIVIARDGRDSGIVLARAFADGILSTGCDVIDLGMVPTPVLYFAVHISAHRSGVMITGSHNPPEYNGLKMVVAGKTLAEEDIQGLYQRILNKQYLVGHGNKSQLDLVAQYISDVTQGIHLQRPLKVVVDAGNGVTGMIAPRLFRQLGCEVHELFCTVDGRFPNHHADPSQVENMQDLIRAVREHSADIGLAFDGDGDRLGVVTSAGAIIWPDRLLMLFARALLAEKPAKIIFDVKCTNHLATLIRGHGGEPIMWKTGHSLIKAKMAETNAALAGEMSGHFFFKDRWSGYDDALYAGARLLEILSHADEDSHALFAAIPNSINTPELKVLVGDEEKFALMQQLIQQANFTTEHELITIDGLRVNFADGWGLVRPSNTTPYLILRFEAANEAILADIQRMFREWMLLVRPDLELPF